MCRVLYIHICMYIYMYIYKYTYVKSGYRVECAPLPGRPGTSMFKKGPKETIENRYTNANYTNTGSSGMQIQLSKDSEMFCK